MRRIIFAIAITLVISTTAFSVIFEDNFENDTAGSFPSGWIHFSPDNSEVIVIDNALDSGAVFEDEQSLRITFTGGYGSGATKIIEPISEGVVSFYARPDFTTEDDIALMGLFNQEYPDGADVTLASVQVHYWSSNYYLNNDIDTGVPIVFGQYEKFDLYFNCETDLATLYINNQITNAVDIPFKSNSDYLMSICSRTDTNVDGSARWYLDNVTVTPEPTTILLLGIGGLMLRRRTRK